MGVKPVQSVDKHCATVCYFESNIYYFTFLQSWKCAVENNLNPFRFFFFYSGSEKALDSTQQRGLLFSDAYTLGAICTKSLYQNIALEKETCSTLRFIIVTNVAIHNFMHNS